MKGLLYHLKQTKDIKSRLSKKECLVYKGMKGKWFKKKWKKRFCPNLTKEKAKEIYINQFLWHVISYGVIEAHSSNVSMDQLYKAFDSGGYLFFQFYNLVYYIEDVKKLSKEFLDGYEDIYICNSDFTKCFIKTHESSLGPYLIEN